MSWTIPAALLATVTLWLGAKALAAGWRGHRRRATARSQEEAESRRRLELARDDLVSVLDRMAVLRGTKPLEEWRDEEMARIERRYGA